MNKPNAAENGAAGSEIGPELDIAHELPPAEESEIASSAPDALDAELVRLRRERDDFNDRWLRTAAEFDNFRKRAQRETAEQRTHALADAVRAFLPVLDGMERALEHSAASAADLRKGLELLHRQMLEAGKRLGLEPVDSLGKLFDPHLHEAIETVETDEAPDHTIVAELQRGYKLKDRLIRPAMVKVARASK